MKICVAGSRDWTDKKTMWDVLLNFDQQHPNVQKILLSGGCRGADAFAEEFANEYKWEIRRYLPEWSKYGASAGPRRNNQMLSEKPEFIFCFPLPHSKGTIQLIQTISKLSPNSKVYIHPVQSDKNVSKDL